MILKGSYSDSGKDILTNQLPGVTLKENRYIGSEIKTKDFYRYGYFEIKAKANLSEGIVSAFWLLGDRDSESNIEYELDIFEGFGKYNGLFKQTALAHYYPNGFNNGQGQKESTANLYDPVNDLSSGDVFKSDQLTAWCENGDLGNRYIPDDLGTESYFHVENPEEWHTYGLDWRKDSITWYIDGVATSRLLIPEEGVTVTVNTADGKKDMTYYFNEPMRLILSCYVDTSDNKPWSLVGDGTNWNKASMEVAYVHIYQY